MPTVVAHGDNEVHVFGAQSANEAGGHWMHSKHEYVIIGFLQPYLLRVIELLTLEEGKYEGLSLQDFTLAQLFQQEELCEVCKLFYPDLPTILACIIATPPHSIVHSYVFTLLSTLQG